MAEEWWPTKAEYDPKISKNDWLRLLKDATVFNFNSMCMMRRFLDIGGEATCVELAKNYGRTYSAYISFSIWLATRIQKATKCKMPPAKEKNARLWPILYVGRYVEKNDKHEGVYIWKLRDELKVALNEIDLSKYPLKETNSDWKNLLQKYKQVLQKNPKVAFDDEAYKWETITYANEKSWKQILLYLLGKSGETKKVSNLFYYSALNNAKSFIENERLDSVMNALCDDNVPLKNRLKQFETDINDLTSELDKSYARPDDERSASVFLACKNPERYTFYKPSYYESLCKYLGIENESAGEKYEHYLSLIDEFVPLVENDSEIMAFYNERTKNYTQSIRLIAQNIIYVLFESGRNLVNLNKGVPEMTRAEELAKLLKNTRNLILHGAPGTGKTYLAKEIACTLGCGKDEIGFVQFHPSYDYTDFVEGIRPRNPDSGVTDGFERRNGVFKEFCEKALKNSIVNTVDNFEEVWNRLVTELSEKDYVEVPLLSGKDKILIELNEYGDGLANRTYESGKYERGKWIRGQSKFFSKEQCYNIYRGLAGIPSGGHDNYRKAVVKYMKDSMGLADYKEGSVSSSPEKPFVFIIDEINRGELSKIFGDLFFSIDPGYRGERWRVQTQYQNLVQEGDVFYKGFFIPENVYIIGTMNDIDRSVESMDFAMRRRFTFKEITAENSMEMLDSPDAWENVDVSTLPIDEIKNRMKNLNDAIVSENAALSSAYQIGAAYFLKYAMYKDESEPFECLWNYNLEPLLQEYLRGQGESVVREKMKKLKAAYDNEDSVI